MKRKRTKQRGARQRGLALFALVAFLAGVNGAGVVRAQSVNQVLEEVKFEQRINQPLPRELEFRDEAGRTVQLGNYFGKRPVILALVYYECPMLCTFVLNGLTKALKPLSFDPGRQFDVVVVSFNPAETPALAAEKKALYLREYARPRTAGGWHFLTGDADAIAALTKAAGFHYLYDAASKQYAHASGVIVVTPEGKLFRYFYGIEYAPRDLRLALVEASANKLGTVVDQVLLFCFHYDPQTGKYGVLITNVIRLAGTGTVLALVVFILAALRRERLGHAAPAGSHGQPGRGA